MALAAVDGGATLVQLRLKHHAEAEYVRLARELKARLRPAGVPLIVNDNLDVALAAEADGVHLGPEDLPVKEARRRWPSGVIGASVSDVAEAMTAWGGGADYLGLGPVFPTTTKEDAGEALGIEGFIEIRERVDLPVVAVGGISSDKIAQVILAGADGVAVISAISGSEDMLQAARELREEVVRSKGDRKLRDRRSAVS